MNSSLPSTVPKPGFRPPPGACWRFFGLSGVGVSASASHLVNTGSTSLNSRRAKPVKASNFFGFFWSSVR